MHASLDELLSAIVDDRLTSTQQRALGELLERSPAHRREYLHYLSLHAHLRREGVALLSDTDDEDRREPVSLTLHPELDLPSVFADDEPARRNVQTPVHRSRGLFKPPAPMTAAAVALIFVGIWGGLALIHAVNAKREVDLLPNRPFLAVVTETYGATWGDGNPLTPGTELYKGQWFELSDGLVELNVGRQARVVVEAPTRIGVLDSQLLRIEYGAVAAEIMPKATDGLTVQTPVGRAVDLGTQFVLRTADSGATRLEVHDGAVVWCSPGQDVSDGRRVLAGEAIAIDSRFAIRNLAAPQPSKALDLLSDSYATRLLKADPQVYLPFSEDQLKRLTPQIGREQVMLSFEGRLELHRSPFECDSATHRMDYDLAFDDQAESHLMIRQALEPVYQAGAYTIMLWIKPDRIAQQNIVCGTTNQLTLHKIGPQLRMLEDGRLVHYVRGIGPDGQYEVFQPSGARLEVGRWYHVAIAAQSHGEAMLYLDGVSAGAQRAFEQVLFDRYPDLRLGGASGRPGVHQIAGEPFTGEVDELAVFDRVLTPQEVRHIYRGAQLREAAR